MVDPENELFAPRDGLTSVVTREQQRLKVLLELGLHRSETIPIFEEATQTAAHFLAAEISILGFVDQEFHWFKSSVGLSRLGLMNELAQKRQLPRQESFCTKVVENVQIVVINDTKDIIDTDMASSKLVQSYGIRSYLGVPLIDATGNCLGALAVMDRQQRNFTEREIELLQIIARWSMSEFERNCLLKQQENQTNRDNSVQEEDQPLILRIAPSVEENRYANATKSIKLELLRQLTQELRTPLTSVLGMAGVLGREIYGPLTTKQREYLEIIQHSGRYLLSLVNEITELGVVDETPNLLNIVPVDIEMLCQQAISTLEEVASRREQDIRLSIEPGHNRTWPLDKDKVRQIIYHMIFSVIHLSTTGSIVRIHVSFKTDTLCITLWVSHPWLGEGITDADTYFHLNSLPMLEMASELATYDHHPKNRESLATILDQSLNLQENDGAILLDNLDLNHSSHNLPREKLGLALSCQLAELHGGHISIQGSSVSGYRYVLSLPHQSGTPPEIISDVS
jgi:signal transduction histidine kinase